LATFENAVIVQSDRERRRALQTALKAAGVKRIETFSDGWEALHAIEKQSFAVIVGHWHGTGLSGFELLNRIKCSSRHLTTPLIIDCGSLPAEYAKLVDEFPVTNFLSEIEPKVVKQHLQDLTKQSDWFAKEAAGIKKLLASLSFSEDALIAAFNQLMIGAPNQQALSLLTARLLREQKFFVAAEAVIRRAIVQKKDSVLALSELGKIFIKQKKFGDSKRVLAKAWSLTPKDVTPLVLADSQRYQIKDFAAMRAAILDELRPEISDSAHLLLESRSLQDYYRRKAQVEPFPHAYASLCNALGIACARAGQYQSSVNKYKRAMGYALSDNALAKVAYNLGLCYLRWGKHEAAAGWFQQCTVLPSTDQKIVTKAKAYVKKIVAVHKIAMPQAQDFTKAAASKFLKIANKRRNDIGVNNLDDKSPIIVDFEDEKIA
jgi:tetratricopeptide (TPR) repeat protein